MVELFDSHTHLDAEDFSADQESVIERARAAGVTRFLTVGAGGGLQSTRNAIALCEKYDFIWASAGVHPHDAGQDINIDELRKLAAHPRVRAIGETGLDFYRNLAPRESQEKWFRTQIELALELKKPLIIHSREAGKECFTELSDLGAAKVGGVFHCYSEDYEFALELAKINFLVSIPGSVTFKKADQLREVVTKIPLEMIMLETDAPYLAPEPHRGKRCESSFMVETAKKIAEIKGLSLEELGARTTQNALKFFGLI